MVIHSLLAVVCSLLAETGPLPEQAVPEPTPAPQRAPAFGASQRVVVILGDARITIAPGTKMHLAPVKTDRGTLIRLQVPGVTVETPEMRVKTAEMLIHLQVTPAGELQARTYPRRKP
jgi:hypothetical protein